MWTIMYRSLLDEVEISTLEELYRKHPNQKKHSKPGKFRLVEIAIGDRKCNF